MVADESTDRTERVVSLCDRSGNMVRPWAEAGYECWAVDIEAGERDVQVGDGVIHHVKADVREWSPEFNTARIAFAFPPCTHLAVSGARWFRDKGLSALAEAIELVAACHETVADLGCPWMLENPVSTLSTHWREPDWTFNPWEFDGYTDRDEAYSKTTCLWTGAGFRMPAPRTDVDESEADDRIHKMPPSEERSEKRSETPMGFARAVYASHELGAETVAEARTQQTELTEIA